MAEREEVVKTLAAVFAVQIERMDDHDYIYHDTESLWEDHLQAHHAITKFRAGTRRRIALLQLNTLSSGRIVWHTVKTVWEKDEWVSPEHDPRASNPRFREYLKLKKEFEG